MRIERGKIYWAEDPDTRKPVRLMVVAIHLGIDDDCIQSKCIEDGYMWEVPEEDMYPSKEACIKAILKRLELDIEIMEGIVKEHDTNLYKSRRKLTKLKDNLEYFDELTEAKDE